MAKRVVWMLTFTGLLLCFSLMACSSSKPDYVCSDQIGCVEIGPQDPVKLGVIQALTGKVAPLGQEQIRGLELALARRENKLLGHAVTLKIEDSGCKPEGGANAALKIVADPKTVAIFGTTCSGAAAAAAEVMSKAGLSMISGNNSAPFLTSIAGAKAPKWQPGYFRTAPNEEASGPAAARFAFEKLGIRQAATINDGDIYTKGLTDGFKKEFEQLGGRIVLAATVNKGDVDMEPVLTAVRNSQAQLVFFPLFQPEGNRVLQQARKTPGLEKTVLASDGSLIEDSFIAAVKSDAVGMYFVGPTPPSKGPALERLESEYRARYQMDPPTIYYISAFDAANILFAAIEKIAVRAEDGTLHLGRQALRSAIQATANHPGVSGVLTCDQFGDCAAPSFNVMRLDDPAAGVGGLKANVVYTHAPGK